MCIVDKFKLSQIELRQIAADCCRQIECGANGQPSCFKMLQSYLPLPTGKEVGRYIALDFGGTNMRALLVELNGGAHISIIKSVAHKIPVQLMKSNANAQQLFEVIAMMVAKVATEQGGYPLAHTFSFPVSQINANQGVLVEWTKEFATAGVVGQCVNTLLEQALLLLGMDNIRPVVLLSDTVATLLAAAYTDSNTLIGSICGTGHNTAFYDRNHNMIINLESGNFNFMPSNEYDLQLDAASSNPGRQRLEKMVAGRYLGELFRLALARADFSEPFALDTQLLSDIISGQDIRFSVAERELAVSIVQRAASLVGASYAGVLLYLNVDKEQLCSIAVDGSLYEKMPLYAQGIQSTLDILCGERAKYIRVFAENRGSSVGAAVAAALVEIAAQGKERPC